MKKENIEYQKKIDEAEDGNQDHDIIEEEDDDDETPGGQVNLKAMTVKQAEAHKQKEKIRELQSIKKVKQTVDRMVINEIDSIAKKVLHNHIESTDPRNLIYTVISNNKEAIFKLKNKDATFGDIKPHVAQYFGLPELVIYLSNHKDEILLSKNRVIDELFPLQSSKVTSNMPYIFVKFMKNMTSLDYILGEKRVKDALAKEQEDMKKEIKAQ